MSRLLYVQIIFKFTFVINSCYRFCRTTNNLWKFAWDGCLEENLQAEVRSRIIGCKVQMESFKFFYGINLGTTIYSITDNLSKALQAESISAVESQETAKYATPHSKECDYMRMLIHFMTWSNKAEKFPRIEEPTLPRKRRAPNYRTLE